MTAYSPKPERFFEACRGRAPGFAFHGGFGAKKKEGFTLLETLVALAIVGVVGAFILVSFVNARIEREVFSATQDVLSVLRLAQAKTLAGEDNSTWGVRLASDRSVLFQGPDYAASAVKDASVLPPSLEIVNIVLSGGGSDVVFDKITGKTARSGTFGIRAKGSSAHASSITIAPSGKVYVTGNPPAPEGTRVIDTRHRAFTLGWSIKNANVLTLTFSDSPSADTVQTIGMAPYFDLGKTVFDWSGTIPVGGQNQTLRIHTVSLTGTDTVLHVDRDCRFNTKKLAIAIDGNGIATYEADCKTLTLGPFGGTVSEP